MLWSCRRDRRLGFDPASLWTVNITANRAHGMFQPEIGFVVLSLEDQTDEGYFLRPTGIKPLAPWLEALYNRQADLILLLVFSMPVLAALLFKQSWLAALTSFSAVRLGILALVVGFIGWWGQGQLSVVTVIATIRTALEGGSFRYLLYDPFSLVIWAFALFGFVLWGRGLFCGWFCPFGAVQEFAHHLSRLLRLPEIKVSQTWDQRLKLFKYFVLFALIGTALIAPEYTETAAEIEPFKTAITVFFVRDWYYVVYAAFWLVLGMVVFKGFCRYVCPLGAFMAIGGLVRWRSWVERRTECGSPSQLCKVKCKYNAIKPTGEIQYDECFQCLDCVKIFDSEKLCVPLILSDRQEQRGRTA